MGVIYLVVPEENSELSLNATYFSDHLRHDWQDISISYQNHYGDYLMALEWWGKSYDYGNGFSLHNSLNAISASKPYWQLFEQVAGWFRKIVPPEYKLFITSDADGQKHLLEVKDTPFVPLVDYTPPNQFLTELWQANQGLIRTVAHKTFHGDPAFSPDGKTILTYDSKGIKLWDTLTGNLVSKFDYGKGSVACAKFSPDGRFLACGGYNSGGNTGALLIWELASGKLLQKLAHLERGATELQFSDDGQLILVYYWNGTATLIETLTAAVVGVFGKEVFGERGYTVSPRLNNPAVLSPDGVRVALASADGLARLWEADTGKLIGSFGDFVFPPNFKNLTPYKQSTLSHLAMVIAGCKVIEPKDYSHNA
jgi:WD40 repeat protein